MRHRIVKKSKPTTTPNSTSYFQPGKANLDFQQTSSEQDSAKSAWDLPDGKSKTPSNMNLLNFPYNLRDMMQEEESNLMHQDSFDDGQLQKNEAAPINSNSPPSQKKAKELSKEPLTKKDQL